MEIIEYSFIHIGEEYFYMMATNQKSRIKPEEINGRVVFQAFYSDVELGLSKIDKAAIALDNLNMRRLGVGYLNAVFHDAEEIKKGYSIEDNLR